MEPVKATDRDRRDRRSIAAGVVIGIGFATAYGLLAETRFTWVQPTAEGIEAIRGLDLRLLIPVLLVAPGLALGWFGYPLLATGDRRWPFGPRDSRIERRRREHAAAWLVAYPIAVLATRLPEPVSGLYSDGDALLLVQAPIDGARTTVIGLAAFVGVYLVVHAVIQRISRPTSAVATADPAPANTVVD